MKAILCLILPALILIVVKIKIFHQQLSKNIIFEFIVNIFLLNGLMIFVLLVGFNNYGSLFNKMNRYPYFAMKYILLSLLFCFAKIIIEKCLDKRFYSMVKRYGLRNHIKLFMAAALLIFIIISVGMVYYDDYRTESSDTIPATEPFGQIVDGQVLGQKIMCDKEGLKSVKLCLATYNRINNCVLKVKLRSDNKNLLQTWEIDCKQLNDNAYYTLMLDHSISSSKGKIFYLEITSNGTDGNAVTIYKNSSGSYSGLLVGDKDVEEESLCYQMEYKTILNDSNEVYVLKFTAICVFILLIWITMQYFSLSIIKIFLLLWCPLSLLYSCSNTLFNIPDENAHFFRAYEISMGYMVSEYVEERNTAGRELPLAVELDLDLLRNSWQSYEQNKGMDLTDEKAFRTFSNTALYAPVSYIPQAAGIFIARHISSNIAFIAYMGRLMNWLFITAFLCLSLKYLPYGKEFLVLIALMPMNIHEAVSLAPDGMVVALSAFIIAFSMDLKERRKGHLKKYQITLLYIAALAISLYKIVYLPFCLFYFLIPKECFHYGAKEKYIHASIAAVSVCTVSLVWLNICNKFLVHAGTDGKEQLTYLLSHPIQYYMIVCRTVMMEAFTLIFKMIGDSLAWLNVSTIGLFAFAYSVYLVHKSNGSFKVKDHEQGYTKIVSGIVIVFIILLIFTSLYIQWTSIYHPSIAGIQGRYFIALLLPAYLLVTKDSFIENMEEKIGFKSQWIVLLINISACASLLFACLNGKYL